MDRVQNVSNLNGDIAISLQPNLLLHNVVWLVRVLTHSIHEWEKNICIAVNWERSHSRDVHHDLIK